MKAGIPVLVALVLGGVLGYTLARSPEGIQGAVGGVSEESLREVKSRLDSVESLIRRSAAPPTDSNPPPTVAQRSEVVGSQDVLAELRALRSEIQILRGRVEESGSDLLALGTLKPTPDVDRLKAFSQSYAADAERARLLLAGVSRADATRAFGVPSRKLDVPNATKPTEQWEWDVPDLGQKLLIQFLDDKARYNGFVRLGQ